MKLLGWGVAFLFAVWLVAFTWIKWSDLGCSQDWTICAHETGIWFRKLVLLEWASKWQSLISGLCAVLAGTFVLFSTRYQLVYTKRALTISKNNEMHAKLNNAFQDLLLLHRDWGHLDKMKERSAQAIQSCNVLVHCCGQLSVDVLLVLNEIAVRPDSTNKIANAHLVCFAQIIAALSNRLGNEPNEIIPLEASKIMVKRSVIDDIIHERGLSANDFPSVYEYCAPN